MFNLFGINLEEIKNLNMLKLFYNNTSKMHFKLNLKVEIKVLRRKYEILLRELFLSSL